MKAKPLVVRYDIQGVPFALQFLRAEDFDIVTLRNICRDFGINQTGIKTHLIGYIANYLDANDRLRGHNLYYTTLLENQKNGLLLSLETFRFQVH